MATFAYCRIFFVAMHKYIADVVEVDVMFVHIAKTEQEWGIRMNDLKVCFAQGRADTCGTERYDVWIITEANAVVACC